MGHHPLNQLGSRRNIGGWYWVPNAEGDDFAAFMGPLSLDMGGSDFGSGDVSRIDLGSANLAGGDLSHGDLNYGDLGRLTLELVNLKSDFGNLISPEIDFAEI